MRLWWKHKQALNVGRISLQTTCALFEPVCYGWCGVALQPRL